MEKTPTLFHYIAVQRTGNEKIPKGTKVTFESEKEVEEATGFSFRKEIAEACRNQLQIEILPNEEATIGTSFDVYSEVKYAQIREKEEAEAEKQRQKEAAEEEKRQLKEAERRRKEMEKAEEAERKGKKTGRTSSTGCSKKSKPIFGGFSLRNWKQLLKFIICVIVVVWFISSSFKDCSSTSLNDIIKNKTEEIIKPKTTKKTTTTKKKSSTTTNKKSTTSTSKKKSTSTRKKSTTKKKTTSKRKTTKKKSQ
jgi:hypothetical protein